MMQAYLNKGKEFLKLLINNGYEAFFVGEVVRSTIMNTEYKRIDIITNATIDQLKEVFNSTGNQGLIKSSTLESSTVLKVDYSEYEFYFQSFCSNDNNLQIENHSTLTKHYSKALLDDLSTKNFTINAIAMSLNGKITDAFNGCNDIKTKTIRTISNPRQKFANNQIDILKAFELVSELKFKISDKTYSAMKKRAKLLLTVDKTDLIIEIKKIIDGKYAKQAFKQLYNSNIYKYIPSLSKGLKRVCKKYRKIDIEELLLVCFIINGEIDYGYDPIINNIETFKKIFNLASVNKKSKYDVMTLYSNGLDVCLEANYINYLLGRCSLKTKIIKKAFEELPIQKTCDLKYKGDEILRITGINDTAFISDIMEDVSLNVLNGTLENDFNVIQSYVLKLLTGRGINFDLARELTINDLNQENDQIIKRDINNTLLNDDEKNVNNQMKESLVEDDFTNHRLKILEQRLDEQDRLLKEKSEKLQEIEKQKVYEVTSKLANNTLDYIKKDSQAVSIINDLEDFEQQYKIFITDYLEKDKKNEEN